MKRKFKVGAVVLVLLVIGAASLFFYARGRGFSAREQPSRLETILARSARKLATPAEASGLKNPEPMTEENMKEAREHFIEHCSVCHGLDGREPLRCCTHGGVRCDPADGRDGVLEPATSDHSFARGELDSRQGGRTRHEGQGVAGGVRRRDSCCPGRPICRVAALLVRRAVVAGPRQADRARPARVVDPDRSTRIG